VINDSIVLHYRLLPFCLSNSGSLAMLAARNPLTWRGFAAVASVVADLLERVEMRTISGPVTIVALAGYALTLMLI